jgi:hypothetical protein
LSRLRGLLIGAGFLSGLLGFWLPSAAPLEGPRLDLSLFFAALLAATSWPLLLDRGRWSLRAATPAVAAVVAMVATTGFSLLAHYSNALAWESAAPLAASMLAGVAFALEDPSAQRSALRAIVAAQTTVIAYAFFQLFGGVLGLKWDPLDWPSFGSGRALATLGNPDLLAETAVTCAAFWLSLGAEFQARKAFQGAALLMATVPLLGLAFVPGPQIAPLALRLLPFLVFCLFLHLLGRSSRERAARTILVAFTAVVVAASACRTAYAAAVAACALVWLLRLRNLPSPRKHRAWALGAAIALCASAAFVLVAKTIPSAPATVDQGAHGFFEGLAARLVAPLNPEDPDRSRRVQLGRAAWRLGNAHPWIGSGPAGFALCGLRAQSEVRRSDFPPEYPAGPEPKAETRVHCDYLQSFAEGGWPGLLVFLGFWAVFIGISRGLESRSTGNRSVGEGSLALAAVALVLATAQFPWETLPMLQLFWLAFGRTARIAASEAPPPLKSVSGIPLAIALVAAAALAWIPLRWFAGGILESKASQADIGAPGQGDALWEAAVRASPPSRQIPLNLALGDRYLRQGRGGDAALRLKSALKEYPDFAEAWFDLGVAAHTRFLSGQSDFDAREALFDYGKTLELDPLFEAARMNRANLLLALGRIPEARNDFNFQERRTPDAPQPHLGLAECWIATGDRSRAKTEFTIFLKNSGEREKSPEMEALKRRLHLLLFKS